MGLGRGEWRGRLFEGVIDLATGVLDFSRRSTSCFNKSYERIRNRQLNTLVIYRVE